MPAGTSPANTRFTYEYQCHSQCSCAAFGRQGRTLPAPPTVPPARLVLVDDKKIDKAAIEKLDGVKGCFSNAGQIQIIFGTGLVNKVHAEFVRHAGIGEVSKSELTELAAKKLNPLVASPACSPISSCPSFLPSSPPVC